MNAAANTNWKIRAASVVVCGMPLITYCYVFCFWLLASATLGHRAQPNVNDPKGFLFGLPATVGIILILMSFAVAPIVVFLGCKQRRAVIHVLAYAVCLFLEAWLFRADLFQITTWIAD